MTHYSSLLLTAPNWLASRAVVRALGWALLTSSCATFGFGDGDITSSRAPSTDSLQEAHFRWQSADRASSGGLEVELPDGRKFVGDYAREQGALAVGTVDLGNAGSNCEPARCDGEPVAPSQGPTFVMPASHVDAHLTDPAGTEMICKFVLDHPFSGLAGGGNGHCSLSDGERIERASLAGT